jgi:5'-deoxynucleotidase YfbR-like HD superfamily hydrolase
MDVPIGLAAEMMNLWAEYEQGLTKEARFVYQLHTMENFLQTLEYWRNDKSFPVESWWHQMKETISDPFLIELLRALDDKFYSKKK